MFTHKFFLSVENLLPSFTCINLEHPQVELSLNTLYMYFYLDLFLFSVSKHSNRKCGVASHDSVSHRWNTGKIYRLSHQHFLYNQSITCTLQSSDSKQIKFIFYNFTYKGTKTEILFHSSVCSCTMLIIVVFVCRY